MSLSAILLNSVGQWDYSVLSNWPTLLSSGPTLLSNGPTLLSNRPTMLGSRPTLLSNGPTMFHSGPTLLGNGPTLLGNGASLLGNWPTLLGSGHLWNPGLRARCLTWGPWSQLYYFLQGWSALQCMYCTCITCSTDKRVSPVARSLRMQHIHNTCSTFCRYVGFYASPEKKLQQFLYTVSFSFFFLRVHSR